MCKTFNKIEFVGVPFLEAIEIPFTEICGDH